MGPIRASPIALFCCEAVPRAGSCQALSRSQGPAALAPCPAGPAYLLLVLEDAVSTGTVSGVTLFPLGVCRYGSCTAGLKMFPGDGAHIDQIATASPPRAPGPGDWCFRNIS